jgi:amino acid adenylation domain-containing protein
MTMSQNQLPDLSVHQLFEQQAARTPDAIALICRDEQITYRSLNDRANRLAHYLRRRGVRAESLVAVCLQRSIPMVAALLGVWKAGGAYVPLDPAYPPERLGFMLHDSEARLLITDTSCDAVLTWPREKSVLLDRDDPLIASEATDNPAPSAGPSNLAYVMYTSGSTGKPKGAMILQGGLVNYLQWAIGAYGVGPGDCVPLHSSIAFDLTVTSLYPALLAGGAVELLPEDDGPEALLAALRRRKGRALVKITPAHLDLLSQQLTATEAAGMTRVFVIGGENLLAERLRFWREAAPATRLINEYGPTETVVGCCVHEVGTSDPDSGSVAIGMPIANTRLYVLDENLRPVAAGTAGELYIGGAGVGRGYLNRPELTEQRFVRDPFSADSQARLYKTGDLVEQRDDGRLVYLGRTDDQVKIRGYRIELGEIEENLAAHPLVRACVVLARGEEAADRQLVAYVVTEPETDRPEPDLRAFLQARLPEFMRPASFVFLPALPLTQNGKVDRKALPWPVRESGSPSVAPRTATEKALVEIWASLLGVERVGAEDNVFDLGAHSLMAMRAVIQISQRFQVDLKLASLFERPTPAAMAQLIDALALAPRAGGPVAGNREEIVL